MGNKVNPIGFRIPVFKKWCSNWFSSKRYLKFFQYEIYIRNYFNINFKNSFISLVYIEATNDCFIVNIFSSRPGFIIGKSGSKIKKIKSDLEKKISNFDVYITVKEIKNHEIDPKIISENICFAIEKRINYKKVINKFLNAALSFSIRGIKIVISGRLNGNDIARKEKFSSGKITLNSISNNLNFYKSSAITNYGLIGVKVWINY